MFWHAPSRKLILFGGQNNGTNQKGKLRTLLNDIVIFDTQKLELSDQIVFSDASVSRRAQHCGFMIDNTIYILGGIDKSGNVLHEFIDLDIYSRTSRTCLCQGEFPATYAAAVAPVFYQSKMGADGSL